MLSELSSIIWSNYAYSYVRKFGPFLKRTNRGKNHKTHRPDIDTENLWRDSTQFLYHKYVKSRHRFPVFYQPILCFMKCKFFSLPSILSVLC